MVRTASPDEVCEVAVDFAMNILLLIPFFLYVLSVATSITLAHMSANSCEEKGTGPLQPGDLDEHEYDCLYLKGLLHSLPKKRLANALLKRANIELPDTIKGF